MRPELEKYLEELGEGAGRLSRSRLFLLSDLGTEEKATVHRLWEKLPVTRRRQVAGELVELAEDSVELEFEAVFHLCLDDKDSQVRLKAILGLALSEERVHLPALLRLLREDPDEEVRAASASAMGGFALRGELQKLPTSDVVRLEKALLTAIQDEGEGLEVRRRAVEAIAPLRRGKVQDILRETYRSPHIKMRASALYGMGRNCDPQWLPLLLKEMRSPEPELRFEAARACGEMEDLRAVPQLAELLRDSDEEVQRAAIEALGNIGGQAAKQALSEMRDHTSPSLRESVAAALEMLVFVEDPLFGKDSLDGWQDETGREDQETW